jgi:hypothetical protein
MILDLREDPTDLTYNDVCYNEFFTNVHHELCLKYNDDCYTVIADNKGYLKGEPFHNAYGDMAVRKIIKGVKKVLF